MMHLFYLLSRHNIIAVTVTLGLQWVSESDDICADKKVLWAAKCGVQTEELTVVMLCFMSKLLLDSTCIRH